MLDLKLVGPEEHWYAMMVCAKAFNKEFPDRLGARNGVAYGYPWGHIYTYRTGTQTVARVQIDG